MLEQIVKPVAIGTTITATAGLAFAGDCRRDYQAFMETLNQNNFVVNSLQHEVDNPDKPLLDKIDSFGVNVLRYLHMQYGITGLINNDSIKAMRNCDFGSYVAQEHEIEDYAEHKYNPELLRTKNRFNPVYHLWYGARAETKLEGNNLHIRARFNDKEYSVFVQGRGQLGKKGYTWKNLNQEQLNDYLEKGKLPESIVVRKGVGTRFMNTVCSFQYLLDK